MSDLKRFGHAAVGVSTGETEIFSAFESDGPMWSGTGTRSESRHVRFPHPFLEPPCVQVALSMWDIDCNANQRADIQAIEIAEDGFVLRFSTWGDTRVARVRARWMAIGPVRYEEDWSAE
ncbi:H-type lectin domain-containing protein [Paracoccus halophilus]|uniref:H-type lectin domain-containing protein n=1 Tax=Paracoccus halophilus TaxID=376733 RepID=UPI002F3E5FE7